MLIKLTHIDSLILNHYVKVAEVIGEMFAPFLEVVVHNLRQPESSIIAIYNGNLTGRKIGDATTDLGFKRLKGSVPDKIVNYSNENDRGTQMRSSTLAIRNDKNELIGSICFNLNISVFQDIGAILEKLISTNPNPYINGKEKFLINSSDGEIKEAIAQNILNLSMNTAKLSKSDKIKLIGQLFNQGHFNKKGAVTIVAKELKLSRPSVYKYHKLKYFLDNLEKVA